MTILNQQNYFEDIERNGVSATDKNAERKIKDYLINLVVNTQYRKSKIIEMTKAIAKDYYSALPAEIVKKQLEALYESVKNSNPTKSNNKTITLYESEMQTIADLKDDRLMKIAFAALILHKFKGYYNVEGEHHCHRAISACDADVFKLADIPSISSVTKDRLWNQLCKKGLVKFFVNTNLAYRFNRDWLAIPMMSVLFNVDLKQDKTNERIFGRIENYDNLLLWLKLWNERNIKHKTLVRCSECGSPIPKTKKTVRLCERCAGKHKKASDKTRYVNKIA
ncbi:hypothetical protein IJ556_06570 [bacterium]|nr:hypothetical protein [bacterium]